MGQSYRSHSSGGWNAKSLQTPGRHRPPPPSRGGAVVSARNGVMETAAPAPRFFHAFQNAPPIEIRQTWPKLSPTVAALTRWRTDKCAATAAAGPPYYIILRSPSAPGRRRFVSASAFPPVAVAGRPQKKIAPCPRARHGRVVVFADVSESAAQVRKRRRPPAWTQSRAASVSRELCLPAYAPRFLRER